MNCNRPIFVRIFIALIALTLCKDAVASSSNIRFFSDYSFIDGRAGRNGHEYNFTSLYRYHGRNEIELGYSMVGKSYAGVPMKYDRLLRFGHSLELNDQFYIYTNAEKNLSQHYSPEWSLYAEPHYIFIPEIDLGLGTIFKSYPIHKAVGLRPVASLQMTQALLLYLRSDIALKPDRAISGEGSLEYQIHPKILLRAGGGGGKSDEGDGILDDFKEFSSKATFTIADTIKINALYQIYRGDLRKENRYGGGVNFVF